MIQTKKIYCLQCGDYLKLFMRRRDLSIVGSVLFYIFVICSIILLAMSICILDGYIKCNLRIKEQDLSFSSEIRADLQVMSFIENCIDLGSLLRIQAIV